MKVKIIEISLEKDFSAFSNSSLKVDCLVFLVAMIDENTILDGYYSYNNSGDFVFIIPQNHPTAIYLFNNPEEIKDICLYDYFRRLILYRNNMPMNAYFSVDLFTLQKGKKEVVHDVDNSAEIAGNKMFHILIYYKDGYYTIETDVYEDNPEVSIEILNEAMACVNLEYDCDRVLKTSKEEGAIAKFDICWDVQRKIAICHRFIISCFLSSDLYSILYNIQQAIMRGEQYDIYEL